MRPGVRLTERIARTVIGFVVLAIALPVGWVASAAPADAQHAPHNGSVVLDVEDVSPSTPIRSTSPRPLTIRVTLHNKTADPISGIRIRAERGDPIATQDALDVALADHTPPRTGLSVKGTKASEARTIDLDGGGEVTTTFETTTSILDDGGLCLCGNFVYPLYLSAHLRDGGADVRLGTVATYVPSLFEKVGKVRVAWAWPLIDRPHRLASETVFTDDALAASVLGGPLDRSLQVVELVRSTIPLTLVIDPELLDELEVMASGHYTVRALTGTESTPGTGQAAARQWLDRLADVLRSRPGVSVSLTPYADPDVQAVTRAPHLRWSSSMPAAMDRRVTAALAGREPSSDVAWPAGGAVGPGTLDRLAAAGARTVVLDSAAVSPRTEHGIPSSIARLNTPTGPVSAALTSPAVQRQVAAVLSSEEDGEAALPVLAAEVAVRSIQTGDRSPHAVLVPPRHFDPVNPSTAVRAIEDTSLSSFSTPVSLREYASDRPDTASTLRKPPSGRSVPQRILDNATLVRSTVPGLTALLAKSPDARPLLAELPQAVQRLSSSAWRPGAVPFGPAVGIPFADSLAAQVDGLISGVRIVKPSSGSYTLGSGNSALPITIDNELPYTVVVEIRVDAKNGLPGFVGKDVGTQRIAPNSKQLVRVPTQVQRSGRIAVEARLSTPPTASAPDGMRLGEPVDLFVHSTVFGLVGIIITVVAGAILVLALALRWARRVRRRTEPEPSTPADPVPAR